MNYTFSYYHTVRIPVIKRRSWWNIFGRDSIEMVERKELKYYRGLSEGEAAFLMVGDVNLVSLLKRFTGPIEMVQLQAGYVPTPCIQPSSSTYFAERGGDNLMKYSEKL